MLSYAAYAVFDETRDLYEINLRQFPEVSGLCYQPEDIELEAQEALCNAIAQEIAERRMIPEAAPLQPGDIAVHLPVLVSLKAALHNAMLTTGSRKADLARKLNLNAAQMERLLDVSYASKVEALEQALYLLGYQVQVQTSLLPSA